MYISLNCLDQRLGIPFTLKPAVRQVTNSKFTAIKLEMHSMKVYFLVLVAPFLQVALGQQRLEIDTWEDLIATSGWTVECNNGYQRNLSDFSCGFFVRIEIPAEDLNGEEGFWTGCSEICNLKYTLRDTDAAFSFRVYLKEALMIVVKNDIVQEYHPGNGWTTVQVDLEFTKVSKNYKVREFCDNS